jgi:hypothetical protein
LTDQVCENEVCIGLVAGTNNSLADFKRQRRRNMGLMLNRGKELIRINPQDSTKIEYSTNGGRSWTRRYSGSSGNFQDLTENGNEILGTTTNGLYYSTNNGSSWYRK